MKKMFGSSFPPVVCRRAHVLLCFLYVFAHSDFQHFAVAHLFSFLCVFYFCLCPVPCVPNVASLSGLYIVDCPFCFP
jgi:hypothetical protein